MISLNLLKFNINHEIYVRLTDKGINHIIDKNNSLLVNIPNSDDLIITFDMFKSKAIDGYHKIQLHELIHLFSDISSLDCHEYMNMEILIPKSKLNLSKLKEKI